MLALFCSRFNCSVGFFVPWNSLVRWNPVNLDLAVEDAEDGNDFGEHGSW